MTTAREIHTARGAFAVIADTTTNPISRGSVLLVPGFTGSKEDLAPLLPLLADAGWSAAAFDQRGQYETRGRPADDYSLAGFAADARAVASAWYGETDAQAVHLVGHSFGGLVAAAAALRDPSQWASLTLVCSGPGGLVGGSIYEDALLVAETIQRDGLESVYRARRQRDRANGSPPLPDAVETLFQRRFQASSPDSLAAMARHLATAPDRTADLVGLSLSVALMRGVDDTWPHDVQDALAAALHTQVEVIQGAGHSPATDQPAATRDALARAFLR